MTSSGRSVPRNWPLSDGDTTKAGSRCPRPPWHLCFHLPGSIGWIYLLCKDVGFATVHIRSLVNALVLPPSSKSSAQKGVGRQGRFKKKKKRYFVPKKKKKREGNINFFLFLKKFSFKKKIPFLQNVIWQKNWFCSMVFSIVWTPPFTQEFEYLAHREGHH